MYQWRICRVSRLERLPIQRVGFRQELGDFPFVVNQHSVGRNIRYPYQNLRKVNFDFAREQNFTHVMELLDNDYRYRLFYIGRVSRKKLNEITERLQQAGVDATCSLNDNKRFFQDTYISH